MLQQCSVKTDDQEPLYWSMYIFGGCVGERMCSSESEASVGCCLCCRCCCLKRFSPEDHEKAFSSRSSTHTTLRFPFFSSSSPLSLCLPAKALTKKSGELVGESSEPIQLLFLLSWKGVLVQCEYVWRSGGGGWTRQRKKQAKVVAIRRAGKVMD